jgi:hypothetical protein
VGARLPIGQRWGPCRRHTARSLLWPGALFVRSPYVHAPFMNRARADPRAAHTNKRTYSRPPAPFLTHTHAVVARAPPAFLEGPQYAALGMVETTCPDLPDKSGTPVEYGGLNNVKTLQECKSKCDNDPRCEMFVFGSKWATPPICFNCCWCVPGRLACDLCRVLRGCALILQIQGNGLRAHALALGQCVDTEIDTLPACTPSGSRLGAPLAVVRVVSLIRHSWCPTSK